MAEKSCFNKTKWFCIMLVASLLTGCQGVGNIPLNPEKSSASNRDVDFSDTNPQIPVPVPVPEPPDDTPTSPDDPPRPPVPPDPPPANPHDKLDICSKLVHEGVNWSETLTRDDRRAFLLGLNISGSFEGHAAWANLANNFDGMGMSLGLLNQTLGTGSLQPMLLRLRRDHPLVYAQVLSSSQRAAMDRMLDQWMRDRGASAFSKAVMVELFVDEPDEDRELINNVDARQFGKLYASPPKMKIQSTATSNSVRWAIENLYVPVSGKPNTQWKFRPEWSQALTKLANHPTYISLQIEAAQRIHSRALDYQERLGFFELRGYLMLFDIVVQNGSLSSAHFDTYAAWLRSNPNSTLEQRMLRLIEIRAASSRPQYQEDVKSRKRTIVLGKGVVHKTNRNLPVEYCYNPGVLYPLNIKNSPL